MQNETSDAPPPVPERTVSAIKSPPPVPTYQPDVSENLGETQPPSPPSPQQPLLPPPPPPPAPEPITLIAMPPLNEQVRSLLKIFFFSVSHFKLDMASAGGTLAIEEKVDFSDPICQLADNDGGVGS